MATGPSDATADAILDHITGQATWTAPAGVFVKLHTGDPGAAGTSNASAETTRPEATFGTPASGGGVSNTVAVSWTNWPGGADGEAISHFSLWDASTAGNFLWSGALAAPKTMATGETLTFAVGDLDLAITTVAA
jgi:hypothetical protein